MNAEMTREKYPNLSCFRDTDLKAAVLKQVLCKAPSAHMLMGWQVTTINHKLFHDRNPTSSWKIYPQAHPHPTFFFLSRDKVRFSFLTLETNDSVVLTNSRANISKFGYRYKGWMVQMWHYCDWMTF